MKLNGLQDWRDRYFSSSEINNLNLSSRAKRN
jgi:hypothetical protein